MCVKLSFFGLNPAWKLQVNQLMMVCCDNLFGCRIQIFARDSIWKLSIIYYSYENIRNNTHARAWRIALIVNNSLSCIKYCSSNHPFNSVLYDLIREVVYFSFFYCEDGWFFVWMKNRFMRSLEHTLWFHLFCLTLLINLRYKHQPFLA